MTRAFGEVDAALVAGWSNHHRKHLVLLERHYGTLAARAAELPPGTITLSGFPADVAAEMARLREGVRDPEEALRLVGCYYAYHFLAMNQRLVRALGASLAQGAAPPDAYRDALGSLAAHSHALARGFLGELVALYDGCGASRYLFCNVGAIWDHEDLDLWAMAAHADDIPAVGALCGRVARESLRWAQRVHFYLSEHLAQNRFAGTLDDYRAVLDADLKNFVVVSQVLQAVRLAGDEEMYLALLRGLRDRYLAHEPPTAWHEGFLRGALTEIHSLVALPERVRVIDPKAEVYRLVRILLCCQAARLGVGVASPWEVLDLAIASDPRRALEYEALGRGFDFAEILRFLFSLLYAQEVPILLDDGKVSAVLGQIAGLMGYAGSERDAVRALLADYRAHRSAVKAAARNLADDVATYLRSISVFYRILQRRTALTPFDGLGGNLARILLRYVETHQRRVFWEDIVGICKEHPKALDRWARDLARLRGRQLHWAVSRYARLMQEGVSHFLEFILLLQSGPLTHSAIADLLLDEAISLYARDEAALSRFVDLFHAFPALVARFVESQEPQVTARIIAILRRRWDSRRYRKAGVRLLSLLNLYHFSSNYSKRHSARVLTRYPEAVTYLDDFEELARMANAAMSSAVRQSAALLRRQRLGDYYDLEFCRLSLMTLSGADSRRVGVEFRRSSERYVAALFDACVEEVVELEGLARAPDRRGFALFATGGNAREDPYDVDYDMFAILAAPDPDKARFYNRVLARLTRAITERGIVPHNRFADRFGAYLASPGDLADLFRAGPSDAFIEKTELLGSRRVAGDPEVESLLLREVMVPFVFDDPRYALELVAEMRARRRGGADDEMDVKEAAGGLRDVQLLLSILKARVRLQEPDGSPLYARLRAALPGLAETLQRIERAVTFLKRVRDVYRLTVVSEDRLDPRYLGVVALFMGYGDRPGGGGRELLSDYRKALATNREGLRRCLESLGLPCEGL